MLVLYACHSWLYCSSTVTDSVQLVSGTEKRHVRTLKPGAKVVVPDVPALVLRHQTVPKRYPMRPFEAFFVGAAATAALVWLDVLLLDAVPAISFLSQMNKTFLAFAVMPFVLGLFENIARAVPLGSQHIVWTVEGVIVFNIRMVWLVLQLAVVIGWMRGAKAMTMLFDPVHMIVLVLPVAMINWILQGYEDKR